TTSPFRLMTRPSMRIFFFSVSAAPPFGLDCARTRALTINAGRSFRIPLLTSFRIFQDLVPENPGRNDLSGFYKFFTTSIRPPIAFLLRMGMYERPSNCIFEFSHPDFGATDWKNLTDEELVVIYRE